MKIRFRREYKALQRRKGTEVKDDTRPSLLHNCFHNQSFECHLLPHLFRFKFIDPGNSFSFVLTLNCLNHLLYCKIALPSSCFMIPEYNMI